jgi:hypothetical protein
MKIELMPDQALPFPSILQSQCDAGWSKSSVFAPLLSSLRSLSFAVRAGIEAGGGEAGLALFLLSDCYARNLPLAASRSRSARWGEEGFEAAAEEEEGLGAQLMGLPCRGARGGRVLWCCVARGISVGVDPLISHRRTPSHSEAASLTDRGHYLQSASQNHRHNLVFWNR